MSGPLGLNIANAPPVEVNASDATYGRTFAPKTNAALSLAQSFQDTSDSTFHLLQGVSKQMQEDANIAAKKDALTTGGGDLADAVRTGKIQPTQNPFYVQDYNREAAYVQTNTAVSNLTVASQSWPEVNNPSAFQARYAKELAAIGANYTDGDQAEGFLAAAAPAQQQAFAANTAQAAANIVATRNTNLSAMVATGIADVQKQYAGHASPDQIFNALEPIHAHFLGTGGSDNEWTKLLYSGVTSAAYNSQNAGLLDILTHPRPGGGVPISSLPGLADQIAQDRYHIQQDAGSALRLQADNLHNQAVVGGAAIIQRTLQDPRYGTKLYTGDFDVQQFIRDHAGESPQAVMSALNQIQATVADSQALGIARIRSFESSPNGSTYLLSLQTRAATEGYSPELNDEVGQLVLRGDMAERDGNAILEKALGTTAAAQPVGAFGAHPARVANLKRAAAAYGQVRTGVLADVTSMVTSTNAAARVHQKPGMTPTDSTNLQMLATQAASAYLATHAGDFLGARKAGQDAAGWWMQAHITDYIEGHQ